MRLHHRTLGYVLVFGLLGTAHAQSLTREFNSRLGYSTLETFYKITEDPAIKQVHRDVLAQLSAPGVTQATVDEAFETLKANPDEISMRLMADVLIKSKNPLVLMGGLDPWRTSHPALYRNTLQFYLKVLQVDRSRAAKSPESREVQEMSDAVRRIEMGSPFPSMPRGTVPVPPATRTGKMVDLFLYGSGMISVNGAGVPKVDHYIATDPDFPGYYFFRHKMPRPGENDIQGRARQTADLEKVISAYPNDPSVLKAVGFFYRSQDYSKSVPALEKFLSLNQFIGDEKRTAQMLLNYFKWDRDGRVGLPPGAPN